MNKTILVAGGSGLIGSFFRRTMQEDGYEVRTLTRSTSLAGKNGIYRWDPDDGYFDMAALEGVNIVVNLTGAGIAEKRWTSSRKAILWNSRIDTTEFLLKQVQIAETKLECYIGASASGIYGDRGDVTLTEESEVGNPHFLVDLSQAWENAHFAFNDVATMVTCLRIGVVLAREGGAFPKLKNSVIMGIGAYLGNGKQYLPWIHIHDLIQVLKLVIDRKSPAGVINAVAPNPVTNRRFTKHLAKLGWGPGWVFPVPELLLRLGLGEMSDVLLFSQRAVPKRLNEINFEFQYPDIEGAIENLTK